MIGLAASLLALSALAESPACTPANAQRATVTEIGENSERLLGRCVTVTGPANGIALFSGVEGIYRTSRYGASGNPDPDELRRHRLGIYARDNALRSLAVHTPGALWVTATGRVSTCKREYDAATAAAGKDAIIMMAGYCHYYSGAVLTDVTFTVDRSRRPYRLTGERARARVGDLVPTPADWPHLQALRNSAEMFRSAVLRRDEAALAEMHGMDKERNEHDTALLKAILDEPGSPFERLRSVAPPQTQIFVSVADILRARQGHPPEHPSGTVCYCRGLNCKGLWPISSIDADNARDRPYVCIRLIWTEWAKRKIAAQTPLARAAWLAEPPHPSPEKRASSR